MRNIGFRFRPLIGVNFCKQTDGSDWMQGFSVFVPLSGLTSVNNFFNFSGRQYMIVYSFRPLIGVNFCKLNGAILTLHHWGGSFRPLIGVNFCKRYEITINHI